MIWKHIKDWKVFLLYKKILYRSILNYIGVYSFTLFKNYGIIVNVEIFTSKKLQDLLLYI